MMKNLLLIMSIVIGMQAQAQSERPVLIDKFFIPKEAEAAFSERMAINRKLIATFPGFVSDKVYRQTDQNGNFIVVTVATWESLEAIGKAKEKVQAEYKRTGFDLPEFLSQRSITLERGIFTESH